MKITVVTPSFNQGVYLERTLQSVLGQDYRDKEYIVIDGASSDGSQSILAQYSSEINALVIEPDSGQAHALQKGFRLATGDVLGFLNSDDLLLPGTLSFVANFFAVHPNVDVIYSNRIFIDNGDTVTKFWILPPHSSYCMSRWDFIPQETCFWRRSLMDRAGSIDPTYQFALDYDLFVRMMRLGQFRRVNTYLAAFRLHATSKSTTLYETIGRREVARVRAEHGIRLHWYDHLLKYLFGGWILGFSWVYKVLMVNAIRRRVKFPQPNPAIDLDHRSSPKHGGYDNSNDE
jgi:glycosyltransferase involved in cell wall biosynthesis